VTPHPENMSRHALRVEHDEISRAAPLITLIAHQIVHLIGLFRVDSQGLEIEHQPSRLRIVGIQIDDRQDDVLRRCIVLDVGDQLVVVYRAEVEIVVGLECRIIAANTVDPREQGPQAVGPVDSPSAQLIFLGVPVFLASSSRGVLSINSNAGP